MHGVCRAERNQMNLFMLPRKMKEVREKEKERECVCVVIYFSGADENNRKLRVG